MPLPITPLFNASVVHDGALVRVRLSGELDLATAAEAEAAVARARRETSGPLRLDLSDLSFLDSTGLRLILAIHRVCSLDGCELSITPGPPAVQRVFDLAGVLEVLPFAPDGR